MINIINFVPYNQKYYWNSKDYSGLFIIYEEGELQMQKLEEYANQMLDDIRGIKYKKEFVSRIDEVLRHNDLSNDYLEAPIYIDGFKFQISNASLYRMLTKERETVVQEIKQLEKDLDNKYAR